MCFEALKAILFDLDGTLLDSPDGIIKSFFYVFDKHIKNHHFEKIDVIKKLGQPLLEMMIDYCGDENLAEIMVKDYRDYNERIIPEFKLYPRVLETLISLEQKGLVLGLVTSKAAAAACISIKQHKLDELCKVILTSDDTRKHKPDPMPLVEAADRLNLTTDQMAYVGDAVHDIECAKAAGCMAIGAAWGPSAKETLENAEPDLLIDDITDLLKI